MKSIKKIGMMLIASTVIAISSFKKVETKTELSNLPIGTVSSSKTGAITQQNAPGTPLISGTLSELQDSRGSQFLKLNPDFTSGIVTGTVGRFILQNQMAKLNHSAIVAQHLAMKRL